MEDLYLDMDKKYCESILFVGTNFRGFCKVHWSMGSWIHGFKHYKQQLMGKLYYVGFKFSWFKWSTEIRTPWLIIVSQYICIYIFNLTPDYLWSFNHDHMIVRITVYNLWSVPFTTEDWFQCKARWNGWIFHVITLIGGLQQISVFYSNFLHQ